MQHAMTTQFSQMSVEHISINLAPSRKATFISPHLRNANFKQRYTSIGLHDLAFQARLNMLQDFKFTLNQTRGLFLF